MGLASAPPSTESHQRVVRVDALARVLQVPGSVLSFLEGQFPEVRSIATPPGRAYRMADAMFLAGLVEALYHDGRPFRDVQEEARSSGRGTLVRRGAALIGIDLQSLKAERPSAAVPPDAIVLDDSVLAPGYGRLNDHVREARGLAARCEGLLLDPVYTGKTMAGLIAAIRDRRLGSNETAVLLHTGGTPALFAYDEDLFISSPPAAPG